MNSSLWSTGRPFPDVASLPLPTRVEQVVLHRGQAPFKFLHESAIVRWHDRFFVAWNNSLEGECGTGTVVRWIVSDDDFATWSEPQEIAPALTHPTDIWESAQFIATKDALWAFVGQVRCHPRGPEDAGGRTVIFRFEEQSEKWVVQGGIDRFHPLNRPQWTDAGHWVMGGQHNLHFPRVALSRGEDLTRWDVVEIPSRPEDRVSYAETSLIADGETVTAHVRTLHHTLLVANSADSGRTWSPLAISNLPASESKTCAGRFSNGQRFLAFNARSSAPGVGSRDALVVAVSSPGGRAFEKLVLMRNGASPAPRTDGFCKAAQWSYPAVEEHAGRIYIVHTITKEDCGLSILPLSEFAI